MFHQTAVVIFLTVGLAGCAMPSSSSREIGVAAVQAVYVEVAANIYVSEHLLAAPPARDYWVKVALPDGQGQDITTMARVPAALMLAAGDTVSIALEPSLSRDDNNAVARPSRVLDRISSGALAQTATRPLPSVLERFLAPEMR